MALGGGRTWPTSNSRERSRLGDPIDVYNDGLMQRDFTYIDDVVHGIVQLIEKPPSPDPGFDRLCPDPARAAAPHRVFNIGNNAPVTLVRFIEAIETALGRKARKRLLPMQPGDVPITYANVDNLASAVGFSPGTSIEDGIARFVAWYREFYKG